MRGSTEKTVTLTLFDLIKHKEQYMQLLNVYCNNYKIQSQNSPVNRLQFDLFIYSVYLHWAQMLFFSHTHRLNPNVRTPTHSQTPFMGAYSWSLDGRVLSKSKSSFQKAEGRGPKCTFCRLAESPLRVQTSPDFVWKFTNTWCNLGEEIVIMIKETGSNYQ